MARGGPQTGRRHADLTRNQKRPKDAYSASWGRKTCTMNAYRKGQAVTVQDLTKRPHPQSTPKGTRKVGRRLEWDSSD